MRRMINKCKIKSKNSKLQNRINRMLSNNKIICKRMKIKTIMNRDKRLTRFLKRIPKRTNNKKMLNKRKIMLKI